jgi:copper homeostasis protein
VKIEVCCGSYLDALAAYKGGANRVELCSSLFFGGLTPSLGAFLLTKKNTSLEIAVMIRPREGGFCYTHDEFELILKDGEIFIQNGADALVFGFLNKDGSIDFDRTKKMCDMVDGRCQTVFHKAFDVSTTALEEAVNKLKEIGISRILTAGKEKTAGVGSNNIKKMIDIGGIEILPAGNVRAHNLEALYKSTACEWVHTSAFEAVIDSSSYHESILFTGTKAPEQGEYSVTNSTTVRNIVELAKNLI